MAKSPATGTLKKTPVKKPASKNAAAKSPRKKTAAPVDEHVRRHATIVEPDEFEVEQRLISDTEPIDADYVIEEIDPDKDIDESSLPRKVFAEVLDHEAKDGNADDDGGGATGSGSKRKVEKQERGLATADPISTYLAEIRRYPLLSREQENELAIRYRESGDAKAAEQLVTSNLRFVVKVAAEYSRFGAKLIDLVQEGNVGLMHAVKEYNPYRGVRLITYAVWWIRGYIQEYLMRQYSVVRIGTTQNQRKLFYRLQKERDAMKAAGFEPTTALLAGRLGVTEDEVETMSKRMSGRDVSLSQPTGDDSSSSTMLDFKSSDAEGVDELIGHLEEMEVLKDNLEKIRSSLSEKEIYILDQRVLADDPMTLQEIGDHYGTTREAVRQLEARLLGKIRKAVTETLGEDGPR